MKFNGHPFPMRLIRDKEMDRKGDPIVLGTSLIDPRRFERKDILRLYKKRWQAETLYFRVKELLVLEKFHARTVNGIEQELFANLFILALLARLVRVTKRSYDLNSECRAPNFKNALEVFKRYLHFFIHSYHRFRKKVLTETCVRIACIRCRKQPGRKNPRISKQPANRWNLRRPLAKNRPTNKWEKERLAKSS